MRALIFPVALFALLAVSEASIADSPGPTLNPYRAYPPSCLALPLPAMSGPGVSTQVVLPLVDGSGTETVNFALWRTPCAGGASALLGAFGRLPQNATVVPEPQFPAFAITQGSATIVSARVAAEPNTIVSSISPGVGIFGTDFSFVFENYPYSDMAQFNYSDAMTITFNQAAGFPQVVINLPAYDPTQYPNASQPMQISGYEAGNWYDPTHSGEGVQTEIGELSGSNRYLIFAWYTFDATGTPYWLFGSGGFTVGDRSVSLQVGYSSGGGFAGNFGASVNKQLWGTVTVDFPDCNTMDFTYSANSGLPSTVPQGSGTKQWTRLTSINGATCQ